MVAGLRVDVHLLWFLGRVNSEIAMVGPLGNHSSIIGPGDREGNVGDDFLRNRLSVRLAGGDLPFSLQLFQVTVRGGSGAGKRLDSEAAELCHHGRAGMEL